MTEFRSCGVRIAGNGRAVVRRHQRLHVMMAMGIGHGWGRGTGWPGGKVVVQFPSTLAMIISLVYPSGSGVFQLMNCLITR